MHAPAQKRLNFNIKQMGYTSSLHKYSPNKGTLLSLETDFGSLLSSNFPLPPNIDALWDKIGCKASFTQFYSEIQKPGLTDRVLNEFFKERPEIELARRFQEFGRCMKFIFPNMNLFTFMCQPKLDVNHLFSIIPDDSRFLFCSTVRMMNILMQNRSYQEKNMIIFEFSKLLLPFENGKINNSKLNSNAVSKVSNSNMPKNSIINENSNSNLTPSLNTNLASNLNSCHSNLTSPATNPMSTNSSDNIKESVIMFAVVTDKANYYWVVLTKNYSINLYKIIQGSPLFKTVDFNNYAANGKKIIIDGIQYDYTRKNTGELIKIGLSRPNDNICFLRSFKGIKRYSKFIPDIVKNHFISLLSSPDFTLTTSIVEVLFNEHDKNIIPDIIGCLEGTGTFSPFLRYIFSDSVMNTDRADFLFKNSSVCTYLASNIFYMKGNLLLKPIIEQIKCNKDSPIGAIASIIAQSSNLPLSLRFVLQNVFKSSRRKFPYNLTPLHVLSDFFMFRFIFPAMVTDQGLADKSLTDIGKSIGNAFMFKRDDPSVNDEGLLKSIAAFLLDITKIDSQAVDIQKINFENIVFFLDSYNDKLIKNFTHKKEKRIHPFTWSMVEIIENCFVGCNENFAAEINASQLFA